MKESKTIEQSKNAYNQWCVQWREQAKYNSKFEMKSLEDFRAIGFGMACVCVANGYSLELEMEVLKQHRENVHILCCDKSLGHLINNGIYPDYCVVCDANVNYEKYLKPYEDKLQNTIIFINVCGNPEWVDNGNWKDKYFFVNKDVLGSEVEFMSLSGCKNVIAAGTNVSNAMLILLTQCENNLKQNFFGYDKYILLGYDYSWNLNGNYYAYDKKAGGKYYYMRHVYGRDVSLDSCFTSNNLLFSAEWLMHYLKAFDIPAVQCSRNSILSIDKKADLKSQIIYKYKPEDSIVYRAKRKELENHKTRLENLTNELKNIINEHRIMFLKTT